MLPQPVEQRPSILPASPCAPSLSMQLPVPSSTVTHLPSRHHVLYSCSSSPPANRPCMHGFRAARKKASNWQADTDDSNAESEEDEVEPEGSSSLRRAGRTVPPGRITSGSRLSASQPNYISSPTAEDTSSVSFGTPESSSELTSYLTEEAYHPDLQRRKRMAETAFVPFHKRPRIDFRESSISSTLPNVDSVDSKPRNLSLAGPQKKAARKKAMDLVIDLTALDSDNDSTIIGSFDANDDGAAERGREDGAAYESTYQPGRHTGSLASDDGGETDEAEIEVIYLKNGTVKEKEGNVFNESACRVSPSSTQPAESRLIKPIQQGPGDSTLDAVQLQPILQTSATGDKKGSFSQKNRINVLNTVGDPPLLIDPVEPEAIFEGHQVHLSAIDFHVAEASMADGKGSVEKKVEEMVSKQTKETSKSDNHHPLSVSGSQPSNLAVEAPSQLPVASSALTSVPTVSLTVLQPIHEQAPTNNITSQLRISSDLLPSFDVPTLNPVNLSQDLASFHEAPKVQNDIHLIARRSKLSIFSRRSLDNQSRPSFASEYMSRRHPVTARKPFLLRNVRAALSGLASNEFPDNPSSVKLQRRLKEGQARELRMRIKKGEMTLDIRSVGFGTLKRDLVARESQLKTMRQGRLINIIIGQIVPVDGGSGLVVGLNRARIRVSWESDPKPLHDVTLPIHDNTLYQTSLPLILDGAFLRVNRSTHLQLRFLIELYVGQDSQGTYVSSPISITSPDGLLLPIADIAHMRNTNGVLCFDLAFKSNITLDPAAFPLEPLSNRVIPSRPCFLRLFYVFKDARGYVTQERILDGCKCGFCGLQEDVGDLSDMSDGTEAEMVITLPDCTVSVKRYDASQVLSTLKGNLADVTEKLSRHIGGTPSHLLNGMRETFSEQDLPPSFGNHLPSLASKSNDLETSRKGDYGTLDETAANMASYTEDIVSTGEFTKPIQSPSWTVPAQPPSSQVSGSSSEPLKKSSTVTRSPPLCANLLQSPPPASATQNAQIEKIASFPIPFVETALPTLEALRLGSPLSPEAVDSASTESSDSIVCPFSSLPTAPLFPEPTHQSNSDNESVSSSSSSQKSPLVCESPSLDSVLKTNTTSSIVESSEGRSAATTSPQSPCTSTGGQCLDIPEGAFLSQLNDQPMLAGPCQSQSMIRRFSALHESGSGSPSYQQLDDLPLRQLFTPELEDVHLLSDVEIDVPRDARTDSPFIKPTVRSARQMPASSLSMFPKHADFQESCALSASMIREQSPKRTLSSFMGNEEVTSEESVIRLADPSEQVLDSKSTGSRATLTFMDGERASHFDDSSNGHNIMTPAGPETPIPTHSHQSPTDVSGQSHSQLRDTPPAIEQLRPFTKTGHAGPYMGKRVNQWTEWSSSLEPGTLIDFMSELDKVWDGGRVRHLIKHQESDTGV
ncbi:hypothetical protein D1P53_005194 [Cryptococcus gattii VGV]|nr:hypothetical protein D1P53_005194 [Cryptococcus gattii VGV]